MILLIDNYDSFVHNLARYLRRLGQETVVVRNDAVTTDRIAELSPAAVVLSPGPCTPAEAGCSLDVVRHFGATIPILGVCLGHQAIGAALGCRIVRASQPMHGRSTLIHHNHTGLFAGLPDPLRVGRYHSLVVDPQTLPDELGATAWTDDGIIMALAHCHWPLFGVQFHPESILTDCGFALLANFLRLAGIQNLDEMPDSGDERPDIPSPDAPTPTVPVTF